MDQQRWNRLHPLSHREAFPGDAQKQDHCQDPSESVRGTGTDQTGEAGNRQSDIDLCILTTPGSENRPPQGQNSDHVQGKKTDPAEAGKLATNKITSSKTNELNNSN